MGNAPGIILPQPLRRRSMQQSQGMQHGFASGIGRLNAANQVLDAVGAFLRAKLASA